MPCEKGISLLSVATWLMAASPSCADAEALCHRALSCAIREEISCTEVTGGAVAAERAGRREVKQRHFDAALSELTGISAAHLAQRSPIQSEFHWAGQIRV